MSFFENILSLFNLKRNIPPDTFKGNVWSDEEVAEFKKNLTQVIGWTRKLSEGFDYENGPYERVLRTTNPEIEGVKLYRFERETSFWKFDHDVALWNLDAHDGSIYAPLLRTAIYAREDKPYPNLSEIDSLGKVVSFQTCVTTCDGAPIAASRGFIDDSDVPPIDTWFFLKKNYFHSGFRCDQVLFCWIPKEFESVMQDAMEVEIFGSYEWLYLNDPKMQERIKND